MNDLEETRPWTVRDQFAVLLYGAPLHFVATLAIGIAKATGRGRRVANWLSRANNRFISTLRPGGRRLVPPGTLGET